MSKSVLISGGGIAGLAAAKMLYQYRYAVTVVDKANQFSNAGFLLSLKTFGFQIMDELGLKENLIAKEITSESMIFHNKEGRLVRKLNVDSISQKVNAQVLLTRGDLHQTLYESIKNDVNFLFATTVNHVEQDKNSVTIDLSNGQQITTDLFIVSEGLRSQTRQKYFPKSEIEDFNVLYTGGWLDYKHTYKQGNNHAFMGKGKMFFIYPISINELAIQGYIHNTDQISELKANRSEFIKNAFRDFSPEIQNLVHAITEEGLLFSDQMGMVNAPDLSNGRVVLLGDAAYCPTAFSGMEASLSIYGAKALTHFIKQSPQDLLLALKSYSHFMQPIIKKFQNNARGNASSFLPNTEMKLIAFKTFFKFAPKSVLLKKMTDQLLLSDNQMRFMND